MQTRMIWITPDAENWIAYIARVSNPNNQDNPEYSKLFKYLIAHKHWSPFEVASACFEIKTSRAIAAQILRHRSFSFQEFSQRYSDPTQLGFEPVEIRRQSEKNRQSSTEIFNPSFDFGYEQLTASELIDRAILYNKWVYNRLVEAGVAKESARFILPITTSTCMYMSGTIRSWIHYLQLRTQPDTQKEHREIAESIKRELSLYIPTIANILEWT